jgi:mannose-6-phosphate isomerase-like protein (cupin superfamily)
METFGRWLARLGVWTAHPSAGERNMKQQTLDFGEGFRLAIGNARGQGAVMVIAPGGKEGGPDNRHRGADQWLYVLDGEGEATVASRKIMLSSGKLLLIEAGETHEIRNTGETPLKTLNIYVPPAYDAQGDELPAGRA